MTTSTRYCGGNPRAKATLEWIDREAQIPCDSLWVLVSGDVCRITVRCSTYYDSECWGRWLKIAFEDSYTWTSWERLDEGYRLRMTARALLG